MPKAVFPQEVDLEFHARPASLATLRRAALEAAAAANLPSERIQALHIAVGEAATNVVEHAYGTEAGSIRLRTYRRGPMFYAEIEDHGQWREGRARTASGRGITIMRALVDELHIAREASGTTVRLAVRTE